jgi:hypothetical protein
MSRYQLFAAGTLWKWISHVFSSKDAETGLTELRGRVPLNLKKDISTVQYKTF